jgi:hypothetical protein
MTEYILKIKCCNKILCYLEITGMIELSIRED